MLPTSLTHSRVMAIVPRRIATQWTKRLQRRHAHHHGEALFPTRGPRASSVKRPAPTRNNATKDYHTSGTEVSSASETTSSGRSGWILWYEDLLTRYPLVTKSLTGGIIAAAGDFFCQTALEGSSIGGHGEEQNDQEPYDPSRSFRFAFLGAFFVSPTNHVWYRFLSKRVAPGKTWTSASTRTALDQFIWTPIYTIIWLAALWKMEGTNNADIRDALQREYWGVMKANWLLWIPAQMANFKLVPLKYQVLFVNVVELVWNAFLSYTATGKGDDKEVGNAHQHRAKRKQTAPA